MRRLSSSSGFTLIELMIVVTIMGIMSAIALPAFSMMVNRSKTAETASNLDAMFKSAASYYASERSQQGHVASASGHCTVDDTGPLPATPGKNKQMFPDDPTFRALGFNIADPIYFAYSIHNTGGTSKCDNPSTSIDLYTFSANGDLDGDGVQSTFELAAGSDASNVLYHTRAFYVANDTE
jgi:prepilin-type N-terminal cleavage/methylation domain-containing protein